MTSVSNDVRLQAHGGTFVSKKFPFFWTLATLTPSPFLHLEERLTLKNALAVEIHTRDRVSTLSRVTE